MPVRFRGGGGILWQRASMTGVSGRCPFPVIPCHLSCLTTESVENLGQSIQLALDTSRSVDLASFLEAASTCLLSISPPSVVHGWLQSALSWHKCLPCCRNKGFPAPANFQSKLSVNALTWSAKNGIPKYSWICPSPTYQGALVAMWKHLDYNTCSLKPKLF
jgi:hypothetical protein